MSSSSADPIRFTWITRLPDGLQLCAGSEPMEQSQQQRKWRQQAKQVVGSVGNEAQQLSVDMGGAAHVVVVVKDSVCYSAVVERGYPLGLATSYLNEVAKEFQGRYSAMDVEQARQAFAFMAFEAHIEKTKRVYVENKSQKSLSKVAGDLADIQSVMSKSLADVLSRGDDIGSLSDKSDHVLFESEQYKGLSKELNRVKFWQKYGVFLVVFLIVAALLYARWKWY